MQQNTHSKQPIKTIVFNLDGVYFDKGKNEFLDALSRYDVDRVSAETVFLQSQQMADYKLGNIGDGDFWSWAESQWKTGLSNQELVELMLKDYTIDGRVATLAKTVRKNGYKTLVCSNNFPARVEGLEKKFRFLQDFDTYCKDLQSMGVANSCFQICN